MRTGAVVAAALALAGLTAEARVLAAQVAAPEGVVSVHAGVTLPGAYWHLAAQPVTAGSDRTALDTFELAQRLVSSLALGISVTRFARPTLGIGVEGAWIVSTAETSCRMRGPVTPDPSALTQQMCATIAHLRLSHGTFSLQGGVTLRTAQARDLRPYGRVGAGFAVLGRGLYYLRIPIWTDRCPGCLRTIMDAPPTALTWTATLAAGITLGTGGDGRFRMELRDAVIGLPTVTGPASPFLVNPVPSTRVRPVHRLTLSIGADAVFGGPRERRY